MFFFRFKHHKVMTMGSMNFIEKEINGLRPDILIAGSANSRKEIYNYTRRLLKATGFQKQLYQHIGMILGFSMMRHSKKH